MFSKWGHAITWKRVYNCIFLGKIRVSPIYTLILKVRKKSWRFESRWKREERKKKNENKQKYEILKKRKSKEEIIAVYKTIL
jgi:hypothetical protein